VVITRLGMTRQSRASAYPDCTQVERLDGVAGARAASTTSLHANSNAQRSSTVAQMCAFIKNLVRHS